MVGKLGLDEHQLDSPEKEINGEKALKQYASFLEGVFEKDTIKSMTDYFQAASEGERKNMMAMAPRLAMQETVWKREFAKATKRFPDLEKMFDEIFTKKGGSIDRRTILAECIWKLKTDELMDEEETPDAMEDFPTTHGFNAQVFTSKLGGLQKLTIDTDRIEEEVEELYMKRLAVEYSMVAREYFSREDADGLIAGMHRNATTIEDRNHFYTKLVEEFVAMEKEFDARKKEVALSNPEAFKLFLEMYAASEKHRQFANREDILDQAIEATEAKQQEESKAAEKEAEDAQIKKDEESTVTEKDNNTRTAKEKTESALRVVATNQDLQDLIAEEAILDAKLTALEREKSETSVQQEVHGQYTKIELQKDKDFLIEAEGATDEILETDITGDPLSLDFGIHTFADKDDYVRESGARILKGLGEKLKVEGLRLGFVRDELRDDADEKNIKSRLDQVKQQIGTIGKDEGVKIELSGSKRRQTIDTALDGIIG